MPKIVLENVTKLFDKFVAVENLNMVIEDREFITLLGPSGCGKTTTLRMIAGLETPTEGKITIGDEVVFDSERGINLSPAKRDIGFLFQNYALWPNMTVYQNIAFDLSNIKEAGLSVTSEGELIRNPEAKGEARKLTKEEIDKIVARVSAIVKIQPFMDRYPGELSGGQQQRVLLARALCATRKILLLDEPVAGLDPKVTFEMYSLIEGLNKNDGVTVIMISHDIAAALLYADHILHIGRTVFFGTKEEYEKSDNYLRLTKAGEM